MNKYDPKTLEAKWQKIWADTKLYQTTEKPGVAKKYVIDMFPYPSGAGLHVGHVRNFSISDTYALYQRQLGKNVLRTVGFDAFGLPTENYAIQTGISPQEATKSRVKIFKDQLQRLGMSYDWDRELTTSDPEYYRWTQWIFLQLLDKGLAYQKENLQWWCEHDQTVLADEQVVNGRCWRCDNLVAKKSLKQWFFKITEYADELLEGLDDLDWPEKIKQQQRNWIGRSVGAEIKFKLDGSKAEIDVFTTRADTIYGATFMVLAPEHELVDKITAAEHRASVGTYVKAAAAKSDIERMETDRDKTGVFTGAYAVNPATGDKIPVWVADYVLSGYGTGAIMAVPAHDQRDYEFAQAHKLPVTPVIKFKEIPCGGEGELIDSGEFSGRSSAEARDQMTAAFGTERVNYKMRDWLISRQRYWGAPIPVVHCHKCGVVPVAADQLPVELPELKSYEPSGDGRSALARASDWLNVDCPKCGDKAERETDTMDGYACSSWYFLRYLDPHNHKQAFDSKIVDYWMPVDIYVGGDHAVAHLLYARFWTKFLADQGLLKVREPFKGLRYNGYILAADGTKMSKSKGNVVDPLDLINQGYGADALRLYELFVGPYEQSVNWNPTGIDGTKRFLNRVYALVQEHLADGKRLAASQPQGNNSTLETALAQTVHRAIKKVTVNLESFTLNTPIAAMMEAVNELYRLKTELPLGSAAWAEALQQLVLILAPFAPHITEELWQQLGGETSVHITPWPAWNPELVKTATVTVIIQVNGKLRGQIEVEAGADEATVTALAHQLEPVKHQLEGKKVVKAIFVTDKILNLVVN